MLHAQFRAAGEPLDERDAADFARLAAALAPFEDDEDGRPAPAGIEERNLLFTTAQAVRGQICQAPQAWENRDLSPARAMTRALAAAAPPLPYDVLSHLDRD